MELTIIAVAAVVAIVAVAAVSQRIAVAAPLTMVVGYANVRIRSMLKDPVLFRRRPAGDYRYTDWLYGPGPSPAL